jgi:hypothetical protein
MSAFLTAVAQLVTPALQPLDEGMSVGFGIRTVAV